MAQPAVLLTPMGQLERYDPNNHKFDMWLGQFSEYCFLNNVPTEPVNAQGLVLPAHNRRRALFLAHIGSRAFEVVSAACAPRFPREHSIGQLSAMIKEVFENPGHQESNRVLFHGRIQKQDESVFEYVSAIQLLAQNCNFGAAYPMIMKTRLISGIRHADTKVKLLNPLMSFEEAKRIAIDDDRIRIHMKSLAQQTTNNVNAVTVRNEALLEGEVVEIEAVPTVTEAFIVVVVVISIRTQEEIRHSEETPIANVIYVNQTTSPPVYIDVNINSQVLQAEVDTGAGIGENNF
ncbi:Transcription-repair-coupling factor [Frankliniella fusca]|uniref:Transcription-repair-coupling factor n=1 Tax=Frankliniella fusca TaxID=407009 RepID=A0AAE1I194_9NEOP|nr:Transcription-repair-coupling factor [Frankliniella fusca]